MFDANGYIQGISIHLDKQYNNTKDIGFSSNNQIDRTKSQNCIIKSNITEDAITLLLTDNLLFENFVKNKDIDYFFLK